MDWLAEAAEGTDRVNAVLEAPARRAARVELGIIRRLLAPPERLTVTEWADRKRVLPETSTQPGPYDSTRAPYQRRPMDAIGDPGNHLVVLCWASQTGKSVILENAIGARIDMRPSPLVLVRPKIDDAEGWVKERFEPMVRATPVLRDLVNLTRGSKDSTLRYKRFPGGFLFVASANSATELAGRSTPFVACDEVDRFELSAGDEGNPIGIVERRMGATDVGTLVLTSSPGRAENTIIWPYLEGGTFELYLVPCPRCGREQDLVWGGPNDTRGVKWDRGKPETAWYQCAHCGGRIEHHEKPAMLAAGHWQATNPEGHYPSFHLNALYSPFGKTNWASIVDSFLRSKGKPLDMQVFVNTFLAELYEEEHESVDSGTLSGRLEEWPEGQIPLGVGILTGAVDVQDNRLEAAIWGWGAGLESWLIDTVQIPGDPGIPVGQPRSPWNELDGWLLKQRHLNSRSMAVEAVMVDSGYQTSAVYSFTYPRTGRRVFASKGIGGDGIALLGKVSFQSKGRVPLYPIGTDEAKNEFLRSQIHVGQPDRSEDGTPSPAPGYVHLPKWATDDLLAQLVSERRVPHMVRGRVVKEWRKHTHDTRNEQLDMRIGARAALQGLGRGVLASLGKRAEAAAVPVKSKTELEKPVAVESEQEPVETPVELVEMRGPRRFGNYKVGSW